MNRGAAQAAMNALLYSMKLRGLKHGSEEEYDMFEDLAVCRARNRRMNGAAESKLQLQQIVEDHATTNHVERGQDHVEVEVAEESKCCGDDGEEGGDKGRESSGDPSTSINDNKVLQIRNSGVQQETECSKPNDPKPNMREQAEVAFVDSFQTITLGQHHI